MRLDASRQGEVTKTVRTVVASTADIRTWVYVELRLDVTNRSEDALSETIAHELALHGSYISKCVEAYRENKDNPVKASEIISRMMSQDPHGNKDHADLKDNNQSNIGVVNYLNTMKEMGLKLQKQVKE